MRKRVLIVSHFMEIGGAERALIGLLEGFDFNKYDVDLFLFRHEGELMSCIPEKVNLLPIIRQYTMLACPIKGVIRNGAFLIASARILGKLQAKKYNRKHHYARKSAVEIEYSHKYTKQFMPKIQPQTEYDLAISFLTPHYFVAEKVSAKKKIAWIHTDYSTIEIDVPSELKMWSRYDNIVSISEMCTDAFTKTFPDLKKKIILFENPLAVETIKKQSKENISDLPRKKETEIVLLSIGRFCEAKNFDNVPKICRRIRELGCDVKWYLIGFGADEAHILQEIQSAGMEDYVVILGKKDNPYPYIKQCDWYIQPSRYEGKAITVREAQILHKPVIITNYTTAKSQVLDGVDGIIVPLGNDRCACAIAEAICNENLKRKLVKNTYLADYSGYAEMGKLYALMEE